MILQGLHQPPLNATLMGVLIGALRYHGSRVSDAWAYGASGHAFVMNVHKTLCPSGPYCWNREPFFAVARNVGVAVTDLGFFWSESPATEREGVERRLVAALDAGTPCGLVNMEYQLITGYDDTGFLTAQPWPGMDFPPAHLTFGTWAEMGAECHVNFLTLEKVAPVDEHRQVRDSLAYAVDLYRNPPRHSDGDYAVGAGAWGKFVDAVRAGEGASHGNWWNAMVWSECRAMAAAYLNEVAGKFPTVRDEASRLSIEYRTISEYLLRVSDKGMEQHAKLALLAGAAAREARCVEGLDALAGKL